MKDYKKYDNYSRARKHVKEIKGFYIHLMIYLVINIFIIVNILKNIDPEELNIWIFSTAFFWGIGLAFHAYKVFGKKYFFNKDWEERKIREFMERDNSDKWK
jgi:membrane protein CcdC involved in cytochrome C biogenesis